MALDFAKIQDKLVEGTLTGCFVVYTATIADADTGKVVGKARVTAEKDELIDFKTAISDEACEPIAEEIDEQLNDNQEVIELEPKFILTKVDHEDGSLTYVAFTQDGQAKIVNLSAQEVFEETLESLFS